VATEQRDLTGFVVLMVHFVNDTIGSFKIGWSVFDANPSDANMSAMVFGNADAPGGMDLFFKGWQLPDDHYENPDCWMAIPQTAYLTASYEYYTAEALAEIMQRNAEEYEKRTSQAPTAYQRFSAMSTGQGYH
jgi:hypothetical protein